MLLSAIFGALVLGCAKRQPGPTQIIFVDDAFGVQKVDLGSMRIVNSYRSTTEQRGYRARFLAKHGEGIIAAQERFDQSDGKSKTDIEVLNGNTAPGSRLFSISGSGVAQAIGGGSLIFNDRLADNVTTFTYAGKLLGRDSLESPTSVVLLDPGRVAVSGLSRLRIYSNSTLRKYVDLPIRGAWPTLFFNNMIVAGIKDERTPELGAPMTLAMFDAVSGAKIAYLPRPNGINSIVAGPSNLVFVSDSDCNKNTGSIVAYDLLAKSIKWESTNISPPLFLFKFGEALWAIEVCDGGSGQLVRLDNKTGKVMSRSDVGLRKANHVSDGGPN